MIPALNALPFLLLILTWNSEPETTYTAQSSADLEHWQTLPWLSTGTGEVQQLEIPATANPIFARLRYDPDGDTNDNNLPDSWELEMFGQLDIDPFLDPDGDGRSTYQEWLDGTDPVDFFEGEVPVIRAACGAEWILQAGEISDQSLVVTVCHESGEPWPEAPVRLASERGLARLILDGQESSEAVPVMNCLTDESGRLQPGLESVHLLAPDTPMTPDVIRISSGRAVYHLKVQTTGAEFGPAPRQLEIGPATDEGLLVHWSGEPGSATSFRVDRLQEDGTWTNLASLPSGDFPEADPQTGRFEIVIN